MKNVSFFINGKPENSQTGETFFTYSPSSGEKAAEAAKGNSEDAQRAVRAAVAAKEKIAKLSVWDRSAILRKIADNVEKKKEEIAQVIALEQGKPYYSEALIEVSRAVEGFANCSEHIKWLETSVIPVKDPTKRVWSIRQPRGVYGVITPWNFPINIPVEYIAPGLATGNAIVWNPSPSVSYCAWKLMECMIDTDLPPGAMNLVTGPGQDVGDAIVTHQDVDGIGFTGSTRVGNLISQRGAGKSMILELGGNGPTIIMDDAELDMNMINGIATACFVNAGQVCAAAGRILVHKSRESQLLEGLMDYAKTIRVGETFDSNTTMGPMHQENNCKTMDLQIQDAVEKGGEVLFGGKRAKGFKTNLFYEPTIIRNVHPDSLANCEETFGPLAPIVAFNDEQELKEIVNKSKMGLTSAIFTSDMSKAILMAEEMRTGIVNINDRSSYWELHIPFGGFSGRDSGRGRLGGMKVLEEMTDLKTITMTIKKREV
jgi:acyl-CoA reductase-like NAD-dependent aldehyde dehydrogenase